MQSNLLTFSDARPVRALALDLDHTLIAGDSTLLWLDYLMRSGAVTDKRFKALNDQMLRDYAAGTLDLARYLKESAPAVGHLTVADIKRLMADFVATDIAPIVYPQAHELVRAAKAARVDITVISASCAYIVRPIARLLGLTDANVIGVELRVEDGKLTGEIEGTASFREGKVVRMKEKLEKSGLTFADTLFYTDSHNDLPLARAAGFTRVVNPDATLRAEALARGWDVLSWKL